MGQKYLEGKKENYIGVGKKVKGAMGKPKSMMGGKKSQITGIKKINKFKA